MEDHLVNVHSKMTWVQKHFVDLSSAVSLFLTSNPYKIDCKRDLASNKLIYYIAHVTPVPVSISHITGDVIANLVSVLDSLAFQCYLKSGGKKNGRHIYFPIINASNSAEYFLKREKKVAGISKEFIDAFDVLEPYKAGKGHKFWVLNELNNLNKHRNLMAVGSLFQSMDLGMYMSSLLREKFDRPFPQFSFFVKPADSLIPLKVGDELFIDRPDAEPNPQMEFKFNIALSEPAIYTGPLIETIQDFINMVEKTIFDFKPLF